MDLEKIINLIKITKDEKESQKLALSLQKYCKTRKLLFKKRK
jgi:hypothetical protein